MSLELLEVFHGYCGVSDMDGRTFVRVLKEADLFDEKFRLADADVAFAKTKKKGQRKLEFKEFTEALAHVAIKKNLDHEELIEMICLDTWNGDDSGSPASAVVLEGLSPQRLYCDKESYAGAGISRLSSSSLHTSGVITPEALVNRDRELAASSLRRNAGGSDSEHLSSQNWTQEIKFAPPPRKQGISQIRGPERFYYDRSTYTGTHRNGGPSIVGNGLPKTGYGDLSELVRRDHIQDDALNRRHRAVHLREIMETSVPSSTTVEQETMTEEVQAPLPVLLGSERREAPMGFENKKMAVQVQVPPHSPLRATRQVPAGPFRTEMPWTSFIGGQTVHVPVRTSLFSPLMPVSYEVPQSLGVAPYSGRFIPVSYPQGYS